MLKSKKKTAELHELLLSLLRTLEDTYNKFNLSGADIIKLNLGVITTVSPRMRKGIESYRLMKNQSPN